MSNIEKRKYPRLKFDCPIEITHPAGNVESAIITDISAGGIKILVKHNPHVELNDIYELMFNINRCGNPVNMIAKGQIRHVNLMFDQTEIGIQFTEIQNFDRLLLLQYVALHLRSIDQSEVES